MGKATTCSRLPWFYLVFLDAAWLTSICSTTEQGTWELGLLWRSTMLWRAATRQLLGSAKNSYMDFLERKHQWFYSLSHQGFAGACSLCITACIEDRERFIHMHINMLPKAIKCEEIWEGQLAEEGLMHNKALVPWANTVLVCKNQYMKNLCLSGFSSKKKKITK